jgi:hypothetical protein
MASSDAARDMEKTDLGRDVEKSAEEQHEGQHLKDVKLHT